MKNSSSTVLYSVVGLFALALLLIAFNFLASRAAVRVDLTEGKLYTLSDGTRKILAKLDAPVKVRLYISQGDNAMPVQLKSFAQRVDDLLREFKAVAGANLVIEKYNPKPDSDEEEAAQLQLLVELPLGLAGEVVGEQGVVLVDAVAQHATRAGRAGTRPRRGRGAARSPSRAG